MGAPRYRGKARVSRRTKDLLARLKRGDIAVIDHPDLDEIAAEGLVKAGVMCVVNAKPMITGRYPNQGPRLLLEANIPMLECATGAVESIPDNATIDIDDQGQVLFADRPIVKGQWLGIEAVKAKLEAAKANLAVEAERFVQNTLEYAQREKAHVLEGLALPPLTVNLANRHAVVVVRGHGYRQDLAAIGSYIHEVNPILIGVDGGADALLERGLEPDIIVGDMDSVSDKALRIGAELLVHAYPDGRAPGLGRLQELGLTAKTIAFPGTSEDIALLLAYQLGATLIVAVGTHSNLIDFLEKGRAGMASTFLVRLKVGSHLVDARGVNQLYRGRSRPHYPVQVGLAALVPIVLVVLLSEEVRALIRLSWLQFRLWLGW